MTLIQSILVIDRRTCLSRSVLVETISYCLNKKDATVRVEDGAKPSGTRLCYDVRLVEGVGHAFDAQGRGLGIFAAIDALVAHAETATK